MTTEILANALINRHQTNKCDGQSQNRFDMDYENDLAAVVFDEVHYISDPDRGVAWEQSMMSLPKHVLMVMLSATISNPTLLCQWLQGITGREVVLSPTTERVVPLTHYVYMPKHSDKISKKFQLSLLPKIQQYEGRLTTIKQGEGSGFMMEQYSDLYHTLNRMSETARFTNSLIDCVTHLRRQNMLPALCFVFSRAKTRIESLQLVSNWTL
jgi:superfamily II RNA helicase